MRILRSGCTGEVIPQRICAFRQVQGWRRKARRRIMGKAYSLGAGMGAQIFALDNPLFGKRLKPARQRLCYLNAMFHFLSGIPRLIFLTAPLAFLLLHAYIIYALALMIALFVIPHMVHASLTNSKTRASIVTLSGVKSMKRYFPHGISHRRLWSLDQSAHKGKLTSMAKGGLVEREVRRSVISRLYIYLPCLA